MTNDESEDELLDGPAFEPEDDEGFTALTEADAEAAGVRPDGLTIYEHHRIRVDPGQVITRVDLFLANRLRNFSRSRIKLAADLGYLRINGKEVKVSYKVKPYDEVSIIMPYPPSPDLMPEDLPLDIVYEDDVLMIVNKPAGMVCHPGAGNYRGTLINALLFHFQNKLQLPEDERAKYRPGLVHRIDKDTTGLLVIAKTEQAFNSLARQFFERKTHRLYYALVWGDLAQDQGTIVGHIGRSPYDRKRFQVYEDGSMGKHAVTHYKVVQRFGVATLVQCKLETGRTHQIRVHFKYLGHTLFGDVFYGGHRILRGKPSKSYLRLIEECLYALPRQALHAKTLGLVHPATGEKMYFNSELPDDFKTVLLKFAEFMNKEPAADWAVLSDQPPPQWMGSN